MDVFKKQGKIVVSIGSTDTADLPSLRTGLLALVPAEAGVLFRVDARSLNDLPLEAAAVFAALERRLLDVGSSMEVLSSPNLTDNLSRLGIARKTGGSVWQ